jgi:hypothetical protein
VAFLAAGFVAPVWRNSGNRAHRAKPRLCPPCDLDSGFALRAPRNDEWFSTVAQDRDM